jgi:outer membrane murein-binding lipoprotein Lpp
MKKPNYVQCFYCEDVLKRPQGRAAHIRKAHPGAPYQPTPEQIAQYKAKTQPAAQPTVETPPPPSMPPAPLTPREHLVAAISEVNEQLESTRRQIPVLETQLQQLNASQEQLVQNMKTLETALSAIVDGTGQQQLPLEAAAAPPPARIEQPASAEEPHVMRPPTRRHVPPPRANRSKAARA